jgi:hypothetical protein
MQKFTTPPEYASDIERDALVEQALEDATPDELAGQLLEKLRNGDQISRPHRKWLWAELLDANVGEF